MNNIAVGTLIATADVNDLVDQAAAEPRSPKSPRQTNHPRDTREYLAPLGRARPSNMNACSTPADAAMFILDDGQQALAAGGFVFAARATTSGEFRWTPRSLG